MKRFISIFALLLCLTTVSAQSKQQLRVAYIIEQMKFDRATAAKVKPTITEFVEALHKNKDKHDEIQDKYAAAEEKGKLTDAQAEELMQSKFKKDAGELEIRRKYYASLKAIVGAVKARNIMALSNDKLSKKK
jgi:Skp family chaperone for outer membrane proteins